MGSGDARAQPRGLCARTISPIRKLELLILLPQTAASRSTVQCLSTKYSTSRTARINKPFRMRIIVQGGPAALAQRLSCGGPEAPKVSDRRWRSHLRSRHLPDIGTAVQRESLASLPVALHFRRRTLRCSGTAGSSRSAGLSRSHVDNSRIFARAIWKRRQARRRLSSVTVKTRVAPSGSERRGERQSGLARCAGGRLLWMEVGRQSVRAKPGVGESAPSR